MQEEKGQQGGKNTAAVAMATAILCCPVLPSRRREYRKEPDASHRAPLCFTMDEERKSALSLSLCVVYIALVTDARASSAMHRIAW